MSQTLVHPAVQRVELPAATQPTARRRAFWGVMACFLVHAWSSPPGCRASPP